MLKKHNPDTFCKPNEKASYSIPEEQSEITAFEWGRTENEIIIGYKSGYTSLYNSSTNQYMKTIKQLEGEGPITGVCPMKTSIIIAKKDGIITVWNEKESDFFSINLEDNSTLDCMVHHKNRENVVGTGGASNDYKVWDLESQKCLFKAKSVSFFC